jgi:hypothetical protein
MSKVYTFKIGEKYRINNSSDYIAIIHPDFRNAILLAGVDSNVWTHSITVRTTIDLQSLPIVIVSWKDLGDLGIVHIHHIA